MPALPSYLNTLLPRSTSNNPFNHLLPRQNSLTSSHSTTTTSSSNGSTSTCHKHCAVTIVAAVLSVLVVLALGVAIYYGAYRRLRRRAAREREGTWTQIQEETRGEEPRRVLEMRKTAAALQGEVRGFEAPKAMGRTVTFTGTGRMPAIAGPRVEAGDVPPRVPSKATVRRW